MRLIADNMSDWVICKGSDHKTLYVSEACRRVTGYAPEYFMEDEDFIHTLILESDQGLFEAYRKVPAPGSHPVTFRIHRADGEIAWVLATAREMVLGTGRARLEVFQDITMQKKAILEIEKAMLAADAANKAKSTFIANISHEIRTPINAIIGYSEILQRQADEQNLDYIKAIMESGGALLKLINNVLDLSRIESDKILLKKIPVSISQLISHLNGIFRLAAENKGLQLYSSCDEGLPSWVLLDETRLVQIMVNVIGNAIKFTESGHVKYDFSYRHKDDDHIDLIISVKDSGPGISAEIRPVLFNVFEQGSEFHMGKNVGVGLGLTITKRLIDIMNGNIQVVSKQGKGTLFKITLPDIEIARNGNEPAAAISQEVQEHGRTRVVLLSSDANIAAAFSLIYVNRDIAIFSFDDIRVLKIWLASNQAEVLILDTDFPEEDRTEILAMIQHPGNGYRLRMAVCRADGIPEEIRTHFDYYACKPFSMLEVHAMILRIRGHFEGIFAFPADGRPREIQYRYEPHTIEEVYRLLSISESELIPLCRSLERFRSGLKIRTFCNRLLHVGELFRIDCFSEFANELKFASENFRVEQTGLMLKQFPAIADSIIHGLMSKVVT